MTNGEYFSNKNMLKFISESKRKIRELVADETAPSGFKAYLLQSLSAIANNAKLIDKTSPISTEEIGPKLQSDCARLSQDLSNEEITRIAYRIFSSTHAVLCEVSFHATQNLGDEAKSTFEFVEGNLAEFTPETRRALTYNIYALPARITKELLTNPGTMELRRLASSLDEARRNREEWDGIFSSQKAQISTLEDSIGRISANYNFVALHDGFKKLKEAKKKESILSFAPTLLLGFLLLATPVAQLSFVFYNIKDIETHKSLLAYSLPSLVAIELFILYFFRLTLTQFRSIKTQLLQIDLRMALCQFIQGYSEFSSKIQKENPESLSRFEALIFSGLVADEKGLPSTFDGLDQITALIKNVRAAN